MGPLLRLESFGNNVIKKDVIWCISNICAGNQLQISLVSEAGFFPVIVKSLSDIFDIQKEAVWCVSNVAAIGNSSQVCKYFKN